MRGRQIRLAAGSFVVAGGLGFLAVAKGNEAEWGTLGEWAGAFGTLLAFAVTLYLLFIELGDRRHERARQEQEQARLVSAWVGSVIVGADAQRANVEVYLRNRSEEPVYDVLLELRPHFGEDADATLLMIELVPPGETFVEWFDHAPHDPELLARPPVTLYFVDAAGRTWRRDPHGRLTAITEDDLPETGC